jgi:hypothetical protein
VVVTRGLQLACLPEHMIDAVESWAKRRKSLAHLRQQSPSPLGGDQADEYRKKRKTAEHRPQSASAHSTRRSCSNLPSPGCAWPKTPSGSTTHGISLVSGGVCGLSGRHDHQFPAAPHATVLLPHPMRRHAANRQHGDRIQRSRRSARCCPQGCAGDLGLSDQQRAKLT